MPFAQRFGAKFRCYGCHRAQIASSADRLGAAKSPTAHNSRTRTTGRYRERKTFAGGSAEKLCRGLARVRLAPILRVAIVAQSLWAATADAQGTAADFYRSHYFLSGFLMRSSTVCGGDWKHTLRVALQIIRTPPELRRIYISIDGPMPRKPMGMHWRTYEAILNRCEAYEMQCNFPSPHFRLPSRACSNKRSRERMARDCRPSSPRPAVRTPLPICH